MTRLVEMSKVVTGTSASCWQKASHKRCFFRHHIVDKNDDLTVDQKSSPFMAVGLTLGLTPAKTCSAASDQDVIRSCQAV